MANHAPISGVELSHRFYREAVRPILDVAFPELPHAAALIGPGSEVLGFDDAMSTDHHWGPRLLLFLGEDDHAHLADDIHNTLATRLPVEFLGISTNFSEPDPEDHGTQRLRPVERGPVNHRVEIQTLRGFIADQLGVDLNVELRSVDWLVFPEQRLLHVTAGEVFHDDLGLRDVRGQFTYYPRDVWIYQMAAGWARLGQEDHLMGRAGYVGDELGSTLIGARLVRDVIRLCFLMERTYAPYPKWLGRAFQRLECAPQFQPSLQDALRAPDWHERERHLVKAYETLARRHNELGLTAPLPEHVTSFFGRPFKVMAHQGFADALLAQITDPQMKEVAKRNPIGGIDQFSDNTDLLESVKLHTQLRRLYL